MYGVSSAELPILFRLLLLDTDSSCPFFSGFLLEIIGMCPDKQPLHPKKQQGICRRRKSVLHRPFWARNSYFTCIYCGSSAFGFCHSYRILCWFGQIQSRKPHSFAFTRPTGQPAFTWGLRLFNPAELDQMAGFFGCFIHIPVLVLFWGLISRTSGQFPISPQRRSRILNFLVEKTGYGPAPRCIFLQFLFHGSDE